MEPYQPEIDKSLLSRNNALKNNNNKTLNPNFDESKLDSNSEINNSKK
jgi:hypothetical protein